MKILTLNTVKRHRQFLVVVPHYLVNFGISEDMMLRTNLINDKFVQIFVLKKIII